VIRALEALEARFAREYQAIYHDGADSANCSTHGLE
jgi:hypothetical protein